MKRYVQALRHQKCQGDTCQLATNSAPALIDQRLAVRTCTDAQLGSTAGACANEDEARSAPGQTPVVAQRCPSYRSRLIPCSAHVCAVSLPCACTLQQLETPDAGVASLRAELQAAELEARIIESKLLDNERAARSLHEYLYWARNKQAKLKAAVQVSATAQVWTRCFADASQAAALPIAIGLPPETDRTWHRTTSVARVVNFGTTPCPARLQELQEMVDMVEALANHERTVLFAERVSVHGREFNNDKARNVFYKTQAAGSMRLKAYEKTLAEMTQRLTALLEEESHLWQSISLAQGGRPGSWSFPSTPKECQEFVCA